MGWACLPIAAHTQLQSDLRLTWLTQYLTEPQFCLLYVCLFVYFLCLFEGVKLWWHLDFCTVERFFNRKYLDT